MTGTKTRMTRTAAVALASTLALASCGGGDEAGEEPTTTVSPSPSSTVKVPEEAELTDVGEDLSFGDTATVIFEPNQKQGTVLQITVKNATLGSVKDFSGFIIDEYTRSASPFYVNVRVQNAGEGDVGGAAVPLWGVDAQDTLLPSATFPTTPFRKCPSEPLPDEFAAGASFATCLVFLAPDKGTMEAVSFRPNQEFDPIQWTGEISTPKPEPKQTKQQTKKKSNKRR